MANFEFNTPIDRKFYNPRVENVIYFLSTALHYEIASFNNLRRTTYRVFVAARKGSRSVSKFFFISKAFVEEITVVKFFQRQN